MCESSIEDLDDFLVITGRWDVILSQIIETRRITETIDKVDPNLARRFHEKYMSG